MGRITVFTSEDINSKQVLKALERRSLPYQEVSLSQFPARVEDVKALTDSNSVPHVFFNTRYVGGLSQCLREMKKWDKSTRYDSPLDEYKAEIASALDPLNEHLAPPVDMSASVSSLALLRKVKVEASVQLPDRSRTTVRKVTEKLRKAMQLEDIKYKGHMYKKAFSGRTLVSSLQNLMDLDRDEAITFAGQLHHGGIVQHVDPKKYPPFSPEFRNTNSDIYRLQCHVRLEVLNTYVLWPKTLVATDCLALVDNLHVLLSQIELNSLDHEGLLDFIQARRGDKYANFQEAACELQTMSTQALRKLDADEMMVFALNLYSVMLRYAYLKVGIPISDIERLHFLQNVQFELAGRTYSFQKWIDEVLRGCASPRILAFREDKRIHFALHMGPYGGSSWSAPFSRFSVDKLDEQLETAAHVYCLEDRNVNVRRKDQSVQLSTIFKQNREDFGHTENEVLESLLPFLSGKKRADLLSMLQVDNQHIRVVFHEPELGYHTSAGPWYDRRNIEGMRFTSSGRRFGGLLRGLRRKSEKEQRRSLSARHSFSN